MEAFFCTSILRLLTRLLIIDSTHCCLPKMPTLSLLRPLVAHTKLFLALLHSSLLHLQPARSLHFQLRRYLRVSRNGSNRDQNSGKGHNHLMGISMAFCHVIRNTSFLSFAPLLDHVSSSSCWMSYKGKIFDVTHFLPEAMTWAQICICYWKAQKRMHYNSEPNL